MALTFHTHYAFDSSQTPVKDEDLLKLLKAEWLQEDAGKNGFLFSESQLNRYLDLEHRLGEKTLTGPDELLKNKSTGERKKLLLKHQLAQNPDFLILDRAFDGLDAETVTELKTVLTELAPETLIIQFFTRREDVLPFCKFLLEYKDGSFKKTTQPLPEVAHITPVGVSQSLPPAVSKPWETPEVLVAFKQVSVCFGEHPVLKNITWEIKKGESWQLTGPNGSGKTTLLSMITGDSIKGYGKDLYIFGSKKGSGESVWEIKQKIGYITPVLTERFDGMHTVLDMITGGLYDSVGLYRKPTTLERKIAGEWVSFIGLKNLISTRFRDLSQTQKRLVLIARAMIKHPPLLILDEPTSALSDSGAAMLVNLVNKLKASSQTAILYVSHRQEPGLEFDRCFYLKKTPEGSLGKLQQS